MTITHHQQIFKRAWTEHQQIRIILVKINVMLAQHSQAQKQHVNEDSDKTSKQISHRLFDLITQLSKRLTYEGANGDVAITLACDRRLNSDVADLTSRWKKLDRELRDLIDQYTDSQNEDLHIELLEKIFPQISQDIASYLPDKMDALRKSLIGAREIVSLSG